MQSPDELYPLADPEVVESFCQFVKHVHDEHGRDEALQVCPSGSFKAPLMINMNYAPMASLQRDYGTTAEPMNATMTGIRTKMLLAPTYEAMTARTFWMETFFERCAVPDRKGKNRAEKNSPWKYLDQELRDAHAAYRDFLWQQSEAKVAVGTRGDAIENITHFVVLNNRIELGSKGVMILGSVAHMMVQTNEDREIERLVLPTWHPEFWRYIARQANVEHIAFVTSFIDQQWNSACVAVGIEGVNEHHIQYCAMKMDVTSLGEPTMAWS